MEVPNNHITLVHRNTTCALGEDASNAMRIYLRETSKHDLSIDEMLAVMQSAFAILAKQENIEKDAAARCRFLDLCSKGLFAKEPTVKQHKAAAASERFRFANRFDWRIMHDFYAVGVVSSVVDAFGVGMTAQELVTILSAPLGKLLATAHPTEANELVAAITALVPEVLEVQNGTRASDDTSDILRRYN